MWIRLVRAFGVWTSLVLWYVLLHPFGGQVKSPHLQLTEGIQHGPAESVETGDSQMN